MKRRDFNCVHLLSRLQALLVQQDKQYIYMAQTQKVPTAILIY
jgi:hypothetical protein